MCDRIRPMRKWLALLLVLSLSTWVDAGLVTRPTKTCGTTTYTAEVAAGCTTIKSSEVDADLNAIITSGVNNIETANINAAGLGTAAYANLSVTGAKLAAGAAINTQNIASVSNGVNITTTTETTIVTFASITTRGGRVVIDGSWALNYRLKIGPSLNTITVRLKMDAATIHTVNINPNNTDTGFNLQGYDIPFPTFSHVPSAAAHTYIITVQGSNFGVGGLDFINTEASNSGSASVIELS